MIPIFHFIFFLLLFTAAIATTTDSLNINSRSTIINSKTDSLKSILQTTNLHDTTRANVLLGLMSEYYLSNPDTVIILCRQVLDMIEKKLPRANEEEQMSFLKSKAAALNNFGVISYNQERIRLALDYFHTSMNIKYKLMKRTKDPAGLRETKKGIASSFNNMGTIYGNQGDISKALSYLHKSLKINKEINDKKGQALLLNNIGYIYDNQGDIPKALDYYYKSLKILEEINNKQGIAYLHNNIGLIFKTQGDFTKALDSYQKSLQIKKEINDEKGIAASLNNIGFIYKAQGDLSMALHYFNNSLKIMEKLNHKEGIAGALINIGGIYKTRGDITRALDNFHISLKIYKEIDIKQGIAFSLNNIGGGYLKQKKYSLAFSYSDSSLMLSKQSGYIENIRNAEELLYRIDSARGNLAGTFEHYKQYIIFRDSINNQNTHKIAMKKQMQYEYEKKEAVMQKEQEKQMAVATSDSRRQKIIIWFIVAVAVAVTVIAIIIYRSLYVTRKQKKFIELQKGEIEKQKKLVEEKNTDITDSIEYAKLIQDAVMATEENLKEMLPGSFVLYKPRDIVSGDFYWMAVVESEKDGHERTLSHFPTFSSSVIFALADCTGHGVPGAFMSMMGNILLNEIVIEKKIWDPAEILNQLRKEIISTLHQGGSSRSRDGMDISVCMLNKDTLEMVFAGANNPCYMVLNAANPESGSKNPTLIELEPDHMPIGFEEGKEKISFGSKKVQLQPGDMVYLSSDGFEDQFGGPKGKKLTAKRFREILQQSSWKKLNEKKEFIESELANWQDMNDQVDDITIIGIHLGG